MSVREEPQEVCVGPAKTDVVRFLH